MASAPLRVRQVFVRVDHRRGHRLPSLRSLEQRFGAIGELEAPLDGRGAVHIRRPFRHQHPGSAYVHFATAASADDAVRQVDNTELDGSLLRVALNHHTHRIIWLRRLALSALAPEKASELAPAPTTTTSSATVVATTIEKCISDEFVQFGPLDRVRALQRKADDFYDVRVEFRHQTSACRAVAAKQSQPYNIDFEWRREEGEEADSQHAGSSESRRRHADGDDDASEDDGGPGDDHSHRSRSRHHRTRYDNDDDHGHDDGNDDDDDDDDHDDEYGDGENNDDQDGGGSARRSLPQQLERSPSRSARRQRSRSQSRSRSRSRSRSPARSPSGLRVRRPSKTSPGARSPQARRTSGKRTRIAGAASPLSSTPLHAPSPVTSSAVPAPASAVADSLQRQLQGVQRAVASETFSSTFGRNGDRLEFTTDQLLQHLNARFATLRLPEWRSSDAAYQLWFEEVVRPSATPVAWVVTAWRPT